MNIDHVDEHPLATPFTEVLTRLRRDGDVYRDIIGWRGNKLPIGRSSPT